MKSPLVGSEICLKHGSIICPIFLAVPDTNFLYQLSPPSSPPGIRRLGIQKSAPASIALYIYLSTIGGCCKSASIHAIYSPFASLKPLRTAVASPLSPVLCSILTAGKSFATSIIICGVSSLLSSTKRIS